jgi:cysteine sulfinate desulfinase/cysteine desulfurase-like protein
VIEAPEAIAIAMDMTPHFPIYMDYGATTPVDNRVVDAMIPWLREHFGNPASRSHAWGWEAEEAVEKARAQVAALINADPREIVWTSGATESNNLAIKGAAHFYAGTKGKHIITVKTEHKACSTPCGSSSARASRPPTSKCRRTAWSTSRPSRPRSAPTPCWPR